MSDHGMSQLLQITSSSTLKVIILMTGLTVTMIPAREIVCFKTSEKGFNQTEFILITNDLDSIGQRQVHCCIPAAKFLLFNSAMDT